MCPDMKEIVISSIFSTIQNPYMQLMLSFIAFLSLALIVHTILKAQKLLSSKELIVDAIFILTTFASFIACMCFLFFQIKTDFMASDYEEKVLYCHLAFEFSIVLAITSPLLFNKENKKGE